MIGEQVVDDRGPGAEVTLEVCGPVATVTLNRPDARNVLTGTAMALLAQHLRAADADPGVRVIVLAAAGTTFCAGADLRAASAHEASSFAGSGPDALVEVLRTMLDAGTPIIARVQGHVAGGGNGLVAAADLAVAAQSARFAFSEVRLGLAPAVVSVVCLARMHRADAYELLLTGDRVPASRMLAAGMVTRVVADEDLDGVVAAWVASLVAGGPQALAATKQLLREIPAMSRDEAFAQASLLSARMFASAEARAGMGAFLSRGEPPWRSAGQSAATGRLPT